MTLIDYLNRVHFADGILEEALWGELERFRQQPVLVLSDTEHLSGNLADRFQAGLPMRGSFEEIAVPPGKPDEETALRLAEAYRARGCHALVAFGPGNVQDMAKILRLLVSHDLPLSAFSVAEGGGHRITLPMPKMVAVPTLCGFASGLNGLASAVTRAGRHIDIASKSIIPTVTICDPTLTLQASAESHASAGVSAIARCVETLVSPNFNPPADGIALDGLMRAIRSLHRATRTTEPEARREMMAAGLNAALVQQKGLGLAYAISNSLEAVSSGAVDRGALTRLILPEVLRFYAAGDTLGFPALCNALGVQTGQAVAEEIARLLSDLPLPGSLEELGIRSEEFDRAAKLAARHRALSNGPRIPQRADILSIMQSIR